MSLITLAELKGYLGIETSENNDILRRTIDRASAMIQGVTGRAFAQRWYNERVVTDSDRRVRLKHWPINAIEFIGAGLQPAIEVDGDEPSDSLATLTVADDHVELVRITLTGVQTVTQVGANVETMQQLASAINGTAGFVASAVGSGPWRTLDKVSGVDVRNKSAILYGRTRAVEHAIVDRDASIVAVTADWWWPWVMNAGDGYEQTRRRTLSVLYRAGYEEIPEDVKQVALEVSAIIFRSRRYDTGQTTGDFRVTPPTIELVEVIREGLMHRMEVR